MDLSEYNSYPFKLNLSLINHFRTFQNDNHEFSPNFLETVSFHVQKFKSSNPGFLKIEERIKGEENLTIDHLILIIHFYFGSIANLEEFCKSVGSKSQIASLSKSHINKTNIMNIHPIADCLHKKNLSQNGKSEVFYFNQKFFLKFLNIREKQQAKYWIITHLFLLVYLMIKN